MPLARKFLSAAEVQRVQQAIAEAERLTSGEIRVHLENFCLGSPIKAAERVFTKLGMHQTRERNGVLIYIATYSRKFAIIGDAGIHEKVGADYWQQMVELMASALKNDNKADGLVNCIQACGEQLKHYFPIAADDSNELSNEISFN